MHLIVNKRSSHADRVTEGNKRTILIRWLSPYRGDQSPATPELVIVSPQRNDISASEKRGESQDEISTVYALNLSLANTVQRLYVAIKKKSINDLSD